LVPVEAEAVDLVVEEEVHRTEGTTRSGRSWVRIIGSSCTLHPVDLVPVAVLEVPVIREKGSLGHGIWRTIRLPLRSVLLLARAVNRVPKEHWVQVECGRLSLTTKLVLTKVTTEPRERMARMAGPPRLLS
jgi:hypothetical protein